MSSQEPASSPSIRPDVIPGFTLATPPWLAHVDVEEELDRRYEAREIDIAIRINPALYEQAAERARRHITEKRPHEVFTDGYYNAVNNPQMLPWLLWGCLRRNHPQLSVADAAAKITPANQFAVWSAVMALWGFVPSKKDSAGSDDHPPPAKADAEDSTSTGSLEHSASEG